MDYKIYPILLGYLENCERSMFLYRTDCGIKMTAAYLVFLIKGEGHNILVDTGGPNPELAKTMKYPLLSNPKFLKDELNIRGLKESDIDTIILTHLHWDHCFNLELFPNAKIYVQKKELDHAKNPSRFDVYAYTKTEDNGTPGWMSTMNPITTVEGDCNILPGIDVLLTPGHTPGEQSILVNAKENKYILVMDTLPLYDNIEKCIMNGITINFIDAYESYDKIIATGAIAIPGHDMKVIEKEVYE